MRLFEKLGPVMELEDPQDCLWYLQSTSYHISNVCFTNTALLM